MSYFIGALFIKLGLALTSGELFHRGFIYLAWIGFNCRKKIMKAARNEVLA